MVKPGALPTGTVTFLLSDIEGSTQRWEAAAATRWPRPSRRHYEILDAAVAGARRGPPVEQGEGDSMVARSPARPTPSPRPWTPSGRWPTRTGRRARSCRVRMALHTGEAQLRDELYYVGPSIIRCARLRALAHGGQVLRLDDHRRPGGRRAARRRRRCCRSARTG